MTARALTVVSLVALAGCSDMVDSMKALFDLQRAITETFSLADVHVHLMNNETLTVTIVDPELNVLGPRGQADTAVRIAEFTASEFATESLQTISIEIAEGSNEDARVLSAFNFEATALRSRAIAVGG